MPISSNVPSGETVIFEAELRTHTLKLVSLVIVGRARITNLERVGFHDRARRGWGKFFSGEELSYGKLRETLYSVPYIQFGGRSSRQVLIRKLGSTCAPDIYLDGVKQSYAEGMVDDVVGGLELEAMEVYRGLGTPMEFLSGCGAIVLQMCPTPGRLT